MKYLLPVFVLVVLWIGIHGYYQQQREQNRIPTPEEKAETELLQRYCREAANGRLRLHDDNIAALTDIHAKENIAYGTIRSMDAARAMAEMELDDMRSDLLQDIVWCD